MDIDVERVTYSYSLREKQMKKLLKYDYQKLTEQLSHLGGFDVSYDPMFGPYIFISMRKPEECIPIKDFLISILK